MNKTLSRSLICLVALCAVAVLAIDPPGTNLVMAPLGVYSNSVPWYLPDGTNPPAITNNPNGWEVFHAYNNDFLWTSNRTRALELSNVVSLSPTTINNATNTTWSRGAGLVCVDTNYLYLSVGTNRWKRVGVTNW